MTSTAIHHPSSYRDPSGFIFEKDGTIYRQVNLSFQNHFNHFIESGCYSHLTAKGLLIPHEQINENLTGDPNYYLTLLPGQLPFISYPYEWSFDMLKDAALLTLQLVKEGLSYNMILKDATPFNIQWLKGKPIFIDSLSFEKYEEAPWIAYRQFCECFLAPLLLMHYSKEHLHPLQLAWPEGIPLQIVRSLLPKKSRFSLHVYLHIHLHAKITARKKTANKEIQKLPKQKLLNLIASLELLIKRLSLPEHQSIWSNYYEEASLRNTYLEQKKKIISNWLDQLPEVKTVTDLGANEGEFSRLAASRNIRTISADFDPNCINKLYNSIKTAKEFNIQPVIADLSNPAPSIGLNNEERQSFINRVKSDLSFALALIHHLSIGKNIPFSHLAYFFQNITSHLIIEFVPLSDEKVQFMMMQKPGDYSYYNKTHFERSFQQHFTIQKEESIGDSGRTLYLMTKIDNAPSL
jgi:hypothetical protein